MQDRSGFGDSVQERERPPEKLPSDLKQKPSVPDETPPKVSALAKSRGAVGDDADEEVEWKATKTLLLKIANLPVRSLVSGQ